LCLTTAESRLRKSIKTYTDNVPAVRAWRDVGRGLGLTAEELEEIGGLAPSKATATSNALDRRHEREDARRMLERWTDRMLER